MVSFQCLYPGSFFCLFINHESTWYDCQDMSANKFYKPSLIRIILLAAYEEIHNKAK